MKKELCLLTLVLLIGISFVSAIDPSTISIREGLKVFDINLNGGVDQADVDLVNTYWTNGTYNERADVNEDSVVNVADRAIVNTFWKTRDNNNDSVITVLDYIKDLSNDEIIAFGDVNEDGKLNSLDKDYVNNLWLNSTYEEKADFVYNEVINVADRAFVTYLIANYGEQQSKIECTKKEDCYPEGFTPSNCGTFYSCIENKCASGSNVCQAKNKTKITFVPWQKRNESECLEGCKCVGAVQSCPTETGKIITIQAGRSGNIIVITIDKLNVTTELEIEQEKIQNQNKTRLKAKLSNGNYIEIKIMPDTASETALARLKLKVCSESNNCTIVLKEVGKGNKIKLAYELRARQKAKILGFIKAQMQVQSQINAENNEVIAVKKPWWSFLASIDEDAE